MKRLLVLAAVVAAAGCNPFSSLTQIPSQYCPSNAIGLYMSLFLEANNIDDIDVLVALEGQAPKHMSYTRTPGGDHETLEIDVDVKNNSFKHVTVAVVGRRSGVKVTSDVQTKYLDGSASCVNIQMLLTTSTQGGDGCIFDRDCPKSSLGADGVCNVGACCTPYTNSDMLSCPISSF